jgi:hypothetical protein
MNMSGDEEVDEESSLAINEKKVIAEEEEAFSRNCPVSGPASL